MLTGSIVELRTELRSVSKGRFLATLVCPLMGWGLRHGLIESIPDDDHFSKFLATQGHVVGDYSTLAWDQLLVEKGLDPAIASVNVDDELARQGITRENPKRWLDASVEITNEALKNKDVMSIYEATVSVDSYTTRADILHRNTHRSRWQIIELKSITSYDSFTEQPYNYRDSRFKYLEDMAYTNMVFRRAGVPIKDVHLLNVNKACTAANLKITSDHPQHNAFFNKSSEFNREINRQTLLFEDLWDYVRDITCDPEPPQVEFGLSCKKCPMCVRYLDVKNNNYVFDIPFASSAGSLKTKLGRLIQANRHRLEDIPPYFFDELKPNYRENLREQTAAVVTESTQRQKPYVRDTFSDGGLPRLLSTIPGDELSLKWPAIYLDFEFLGTAVPLWGEKRDGSGNILQPAARPYEPIPVQYSLHVSKPECNNLFPYPIHLPAEPVFEKSFMSLPGKDMRLKMALQLALDLKEAASAAGARLEDCSILVWHQTAELSCLNYFVGGTEKYPNPFPWLPKWAIETLQVARKNLVDLLNIVRGGRVRPAVPNFRTKLNFYHPAFKGSFSLKNVVKMLDSNPYESGAISSGAEAFAKYGELSYAYSRLAPNHWNIDDYSQEEISDILDSLNGYCKDDTYSLFRVHQELAKQARKCLLGDDSIIRYKDIPFSGDTTLDLGRRIPKRLPGVFN